MIPKVIAALGDSITQGYFDNTGAGWFGRLAARISENGMYGFHNISMAGDRICDAWHRFSSQCMTMDISVLIIAIGCNDIMRRGSITAQLDLSRELRAEYWNWLLDAAQRNIKNVIVLDILPVREEAGGASEEYIYNMNRDIIEYNGQLAYICNARNIPFIRRYKNWESRNLADYYTDWGHPNGTGHQMIADEVYNELKTLKVI